MRQQRESGRLNRPAQTRSITLGDLRITYVPDGHVQLKPRRWLPDADESDWQELADYLNEEGNLVASIGGLLVQHGDRAMLIDAGFGPYSVPDKPDNPHGEGVGGALLDNLETLGCPPASIEAVAITHLHVDHVGWAWSSAPGTSSPAFTSAQYVMTEAEWANPELAIAAGTDQSALDILEPKVRTIQDGDEIFPGVHVRVASGHTAGHAAYIVTSGDQRLIAFGDLMHSPVQVTHPNWSAASDHDGELSAHHRNLMIGELLQPNTIGFGVHFADVPFGRVVSEDGTTRWVPVD